MDKCILHCDANNFFASVEIKLNNSLQGKAVAVSGNPEHRHGIILAKNELAKKYGVQTGEVIWQAKQKCKDLVLVAPHYDEYVKFSRKLFKIYSSFTNKVESFGIDECWLDVTGSLHLFESPEHLANEISKRVKNEVGITISIGVSFTKIFAKIGSDYKKPDAITYITKENFKDIVWPLPVNTMLMIGKRTNQYLNSIGINTIGDLAKADQNKLKNKLGINAEKIIKSANGIELEDVKYSSDQRTPSSIGHSTTLIRDIRNQDEVEAVVASLCEMISFRLKSYDLSGKGISITLRYSDLSTFSRQKKSNSQLTNSIDIFNNAMELFNKYYSYSSKDKPLRGLGISVYNLSKKDEFIQLTLFDNITSNSYESKQKLDNSIDLIRQKYGYTSIKKGIVSKHNNLCENLIPSDFVAFKKISLDYENDDQF